MGCTKQIHYDLFTLALTGIANGCLSNRQARRREYPTKQMDKQNRITRIQP